MVGVQYSTLRWAHILFLFCLFCFIPGTASEESNTRLFFGTLCTRNKTLYLREHFIILVGYYYSNDYCQCYDYQYYYLINCILIFDFTHHCLAQFLFIFVLWLTTVGSKKWFSTGVMCFEPIWTASGQTYWVVMEVVGITYPTFPGFLQCSASIPKHQHQDEHRLSNRKSSALWIMLVGTRGGGYRDRFGSHGPHLSWHKMQALPCCTCGFKVQWDLSSSPFCFSALQDSWTELRLLSLV